MRDSVRRQYRRWGRETVSLLSVLCLGGSLLALGGCAAQRASGPRPPVPSDDLLPGAGRPLPSEENRVSGTAPSAFPDYPADLSRGTNSTWPTGRDSEGNSRRGVEGGGASTSDGAASSLGSSGDASPGTPPLAPVTPTATPATPLETLSPDPVRPPAVIPKEDFYTVQLQVSSTAERAQEWQERASKLFRVPVRVDLEGGLHKLRVGMFTRVDGAEDLRREAVAAGYVDALVLSVAGAAGGGGAR